MLVKLVKERDLLYVVKYDVATIIVVVVCGIAVGGKTP